MRERGFGRVDDGTTFGVHFHCYRRDDTQENQKGHEHGEALVLCVPPSPSGSTPGDLAFDLRYLSVASRVAATTKKRFLVAFQDDTTEQIRLIELTSL